MLKRSFLLNRNLSTLTILSITFACAVFTSSRIEAQEFVALDEFTDPLIIDDILVRGLLCSHEERELSKEEIEVIADHVKDFKEARDRTPPEADLTFLYSPNCRPSKRSKELYDNLPSKYEGTAIDCSKTPLPAECNDSRAVVPSITIKFPARDGKPERTITIKGKPEVEKFLEELGK